MRTRANDFQELRCRRCQSKIKTDGETRFRSIISAYDDADT